MSIDELEERLTQTVQRFEGLLEAICAGQQLLMVAGFAMYQAGVVQPKNVTSVLVKSLLDTTLIALSWWLIGKALRPAPLHSNANGRELVCRVYCAKVIVET